MKYDEEYVLVQTKLQDRYHKITTKKGQILNYWPWRRLIRAIGKFKFKIKIHAII